MVFFILYPPLKRLPPNIVSVETWRLPYLPKISIWVVSRSVMCCAGHREYRDEYSWPYDTVQIFSSGRGKYIQGCMDNLLFLHGIPCSSKNELKLSTSLHLRYLHEWTKEVQCWYRTLCYHWFCKYRQRILETRFGIELTLSMKERSGVKLKPMKPSTFLGKFYFLL